MGPLQIVVITPHVLELVWNIYVSSFPTSSVYMTMPIDIKIVDDYNLTSHSTDSRILSSATVLN